MLSGQKFAGTALSYPNAFIGYPVNPELSGFPLKTCGKDLSRAIKQNTQISNRTTLSYLKIIINGNKRHPCVLSNK